MKNRARQPVVIVLFLLALSLSVGAGRPDLTAKPHAFELPTYALIAIWFVRSFGVEGAAIASVFRVALDAVLLLWLARRCFNMRFFVLLVCVGIPLLLVAFALSRIGANMILRCAFASFILLSCIPTAELALSRFAGEPITDGMLADV